MIFLKLVKLKLIITFTLFLPIALLLFSPMYVYHVLLCELHRVFFVNTSMPQLPSVSGWWSNAICTHTVIIKLSAYPFYHINKHILWWWYPFFSHCCHCCMCIFEWLTKWVFCLNCVQVSARFCYSAVLRPRLKFHSLLQVSGVSSR